MMPRKSDNDGGSSRWTASPLFKGKEDESTDERMSMESTHSVALDEIKADEEALWDGKHLFGLLCFALNVCACTIAVYASTFPNDPYDQIVAGMSMVPLIAGLLITHLIATTGEVRAPPADHPTSAAARRSRSWLRRVTLDEFSVDEIVHTCMAVTVLEYDYVVGLCHTESGLTTRSECYVRSSLLAALYLVFIVLVYWFLFGLRRAVRMYQGEDIQVFVSGMVVRWVILMQMEWWLLSLALWRAVAGEVGDGDGTSGSIRNVLFGSPGHQAQGYIFTAVIGSHLLALGLGFELCYGAGLISGTRLLRMRFETHEIIVGFLFGIANTMAVFILASQFTSEFGNRLSTIAWFASPVIWVCWVGIIISVLVVIAPRNLRLQRCVGRSGFHIFLSYRRTHTDFADRIKRGLEKYGYRVFYDIDPLSGLGAGNFQSMLENVLYGVPVVIPVLTPPPAGLDWRKEFSSLGAVKEARKRASRPGEDAMQPKGVELLYNGRMLRPGEAPPPGVEPTEMPFYDWCERELMLVLQSDALVIPVCKEGLDIGLELSGLPPTLAELPTLNARVLHDDLFDASLEVIHHYIQQHFAKI